MGTAMTTETTMGADGYGHFTTKQMLEFLQNKIEEDHLALKPSSMMIDIRDYILKHENANQTTVMLPNTANKAVGEPSDSPIGSSPAPLSNDNEHTAEAIEKLLADKYNIVVLGIKAQIVKILESELSRLKDGKRELQDALKNLLSIENSVNEE